MVRLQTKGHWSLFCFCFVKDFQNVDSWPLPICISYWVLIHLIFTKLFIILIEWNQCLLLDESYYNACTIHSSLQQLTLWWRSYNADVVIKNSYLLSQSFILTRWHSILLLCINLLFCCLWKIFKWLFLWFSQIYTILWNMMPCSQVEVYQLVSRRICLHIQGQRVSHAVSEKMVAVCSSEVSVKFC
jgi:hypothetical protein